MKTNRIVRQIRTPDGRHVAGYSITVEKPGRIVRHIARVNKTARWNWNYCSSFAKAIAERPVWALNLLADGNTVIDLRQQQPSARRAAA